MASLVSVAEAKVHLRVMHAEEDALIQTFLDAAQEQATAFLGRAVYADAGALSAAITQAPTDLSAAGAAYNSALAAAGLFEDPDERTAAERAAMFAYWAAVEAAERVRRGIVITPAVKTAILLITAALWEHRGDEVELDGMPQAARAFLWPLRVGIGV